MRQNSLLEPDNSKSNFIFQFLYQVIILVVPLFVSPYLTRTLGSNSLGVYTYTYSIAYYFSIFAMLGINKHGQRIIAQRRSDVQKLRSTFWSLYFVHFIASLLALSLYLIYVVAICKSDRDIALIQSIYVFSSVVNITWLFYGLEKFKIVAVRNAIVKLLETVCIFIFVHDSSDVGVYTAIMSISVCLGQIVMMPQVLRAIPPVRVYKKDMLEHIKPMLTLFAAVVASTLYTTFDKTLLGFLSTKDDVAFYEYSYKIIQLPQTFMGIIGTVLFPKASILISQGKEKELKRNFKLSLFINYFIGFACFFGLLAVSDLFVLLYYGADFTVCGEIIMSMCPLILIIGIGETVRMLYVYPMGKDMTMVKILFCNAALNLVCSCLLIPSMGVYGAVLGTTLAETFGIVIEIYICRKELPVTSVFTEGLPFLLIGLAMYGCIKFVTTFFDGSIWALLIQIIVGAIVYCLLTLVYVFLFKKEVKKFLIDNLRKVQTKFVKNNYK